MHQNNFSNMLSKYAKELPKNENFVKVTEKKTPESDNPGISKISKSATTDTNTNKIGKSSAPIVSEITDLRKQVGELMDIEFSDEGFVKLPRSLLNDPNWQRMRLKYKMVFLTLLNHTSYTQRTYSISTNLITIGPGQFCTSIRNLVDLCNQGVIFNEDKIDKNIVERSVSLFTKVGLVRQEVRHKKCIFTITYPELYDHFKKQSETQTETRPRHNRDTNEERKERKDIEETIEGAVALDSSLINKKKEEGTKGPSVFTPETPKTQSKLSEEKQKHFHLLWEFVVKNKIAAGMTPKPGIKEQDLINWLQKYQATEILECLKFAIKATITKTYGGYVTKLLKDRIPKQEEDSKQGRQFVEKFIKENGMKHIDLKKDYFKDLISDEQSYYYLPMDTLKAILKRSLERFNEQEERERRENQEDEYY